MALAWSVALNPTQISRRHGASDRHMQALMLIQQQKAHCNLHKLKQRGKQNGSTVLYASLGETVEDKDTNSSKDERPSQKLDQVDATKPSTVTSASPFVGGKISSRIAARAGDIANGRGQSATTTPPTPSSSKTPGPPPFDLSIPKSQRGASSSPKIPGSQTFSPNPPNSQGSPFSSTLTGTEKLKGAKPSVFLDSRVGGAFKEPGSKTLLDTMRQSDNNTKKFGQPGLPRNLFDEPEKLTAEDNKRFDFTLNIGQLALIFSFLTIICVMLGTAFLVWKVGAIHYNEF
ncbi:hypothetical protein L7F22_022882 [Adiantum nelumboides]|nr:hypothetical protein [Adiantum nelumboides]MCO5569172.1 hypothetical protein [Adiantum nelumboides]